MLQALLRDRFKLTVHRESRPILAYSLTVRNQPELDKHKIVPDWTGIRPSRRGDDGSLREPFFGSLSMFARMLTGLMRMAVLDDRHQADKPADKYDLWFDIRPEGPASDPELVVRSVADQGLKRELKKMPMDVVVVDRFEKMPTSN